MPGSQVWPNSKKTKLLVKDSYHSKAVSLFATTNIEIITNGMEYLGGAIGSAQFVESILSKKVMKWTDEIRKLAEIASTEPHAAFAAFTHGISTGWQYFFRVTNLSSLPSNSQLLVQLESCIRLKLIPALVGFGNISVTLRNLLSLPFRLRGLNIIDPTQFLLHQHTTSRQINFSLTLSNSTQSTSHSNSVRGKRKRSPFVTTLQ